MISEKINEILKINESYEMPEAMMNMLLSQDKDKILSQIANNYDFSKDDFRDYFQTEHGDREKYKQDYTPDCICTLLSKLIQNKQTFTDVCSGTGALSISMINSETKEISCEELSGRAIPVLICNLALRNVNAIVKQKNIITDKVDNIFVLSHGEKFSNITKSDKEPEEKSNLFISNPPYSLGWEQKRDSRFTGYDLPPSSKADYVFVIDVINRLACNGEAFFILPHGILFRGQKEGKIRQTIVENNLLDAIIGLPDNMFLNTNIPVCIFCLKKNKNTKDVFFINAAQDFEKNGKQNFMSDAQIKKIVDVYKNRTNIDNFSKVVTKENIIDNDYNLNISRYIEDRQNKEEIDLSKEIIDLININNDIKNINKEISNILKEIHGDNQYENNAKQLIRWLEND